MKRSDLNRLRRELTAQQQRVLQIIEAGIARGNPPTRREIASAMGFRSGNAADEHVRALATLGFIVIEPGKARNIRLTNGGPEGGAAIPRATAASRAVIDVAPGAAGGPALPLSDLAMEQGLAEVGITTWGPRAEDWAAGAEYAVRLMRECLPKAAAETLPDRPDVACNPAACRDSSAAPPALRRDDADGAGAAGQTDKDGVVDESPNLQGLPVDRSADLRGGGDCAQGVGVVSASPWYLWLERRYGPEIAARVIGETMEYDRQQRAGDDLPGAALASQKSEGEAC